MMELLNPKSWEIGHFFFAWFSSCTHWPDGIFSSGRAVLRKKVVVSEDFYFSLTSVILLGEVVSSQMEER